MSMIIRKNFRIAKRRKANFLGSHLRNWIKASPKDKITSAISGSD